MLAVTDRDARVARPPAHLRVSSLRKSFAGREVLKGITLDVPRGECVVLLGANGSGKSTALRCCVGLAEPDAGTIVVDGRSAAALHGSSLAAHRRETAMIFQNINLVRRRTALDNVCAGALGRVSTRRSLTPLLFPAALREEAMGCLERVGLAHRAADRVKALSGGQQQRVAIARALCQRASVVLADEPVAALDPAAAEQVMALLRELAHAEGLAVCVVLHQPDLARRHADRLVGLLEGRIVFDAASGHVGDDEIDALYRAQSAVPAAARER